MIYLKEKHGIWKDLCTRHRRAPARVEHSQSRRSATLPMASLLDVQGRCAISFVNIKIKC